LLITEVKLLLCDRYLTNDYAINIHLNDFSEDQEKLKRVIYGPKKTKTIVQKS